MINLAVSSKVTLSFRSTLFLSSSSLSSSEHPLSSRSYQEWDIAVRLEKSEVQNPKFKVQSSKFKVQNSKFKVQSSKFKVQSFAILLQTTATAFKILIFCLLGSSYLVEKFIQAARKSDIEVYASGTFHFIWNGIANILSS